MYEHGEYIIMDIDGFSGKDAMGKQIMIPRECGIVWLSLHHKPSISAHYGLYFNGGLTKDFLKNNARTLSFQSKNVHGFSTNDNIFRQALPSTSYYHNLSNISTAEALEDVKRIIIQTLDKQISLIHQIQSTQVPIILTHKGGNERTFFSIIESLYDNITIKDLGNDLNVADVLNSSLNTSFKCSAEIHSNVSRAWYRHCPQVECWACATWLMKQ